MRRLFLVMSTGLLLVYSCRKQPSSSGVVGYTPPPADTTRSGKTDTSKPIGGDTTTKPRPSIIKIYESNGWQITFDSKTKGVHEMQGGGSWMPVWEILDPTDTGDIRAEFINFTSSASARFWGTYERDTNWVFMCSNMNFLSNENQAIDTAGKVAVHVYRADGRDVKPGIKEMYFYLSMIPGATSLVGNGQMGITNYHGDSTALSPDWLNSKLKEERYYFRQYDTAWDAN